MVIFISKNRYDALLANIENSNDKIVDLETRVSVLEKELDKTIKSVDEAKESKEIKDEWLYGAKEEGK